MDACAASDILQKRATAHAWDAFYGPVLGRQLLEWSTKSVGVVESPNSRQYLVR